MGCIFCTLGSAFSVILDALERISIWTVCALLTCCLAITLITVLLIGIGIGYHYCYVHYVGAWNKTSQAHYFYHSFNQFIRDNIHRITKRELKANGSARAEIDINHSVERIPVYNVSKSYLVM